MTTNDGAKVTVDLAAIDAVIAQIEQHPETWNQREWRCDTGMCVAGWLCQLNGDRWLASNPGSRIAALVIAPMSATLGDGTNYNTPFFEDHVAEALGGYDKLPDDMGIYHAQHRAMNIICRVPGNSVSISDVDGTLTGLVDDLFGCNNTIEEIKAIRDELAIRQGDQTIYGA